jgi:hypothetical protein
MNATVRTVGRTGGPVVPALPEEVPIEFYE